MNAVSRKDKARDTASAIELYYYHESQKLMQTLQEVDDYVFLRSCRREDINPETLATATVSPYGPYRHYFRLIGNPRLLLDVRGNEGDKGDKDTVMQWVKANCNEQCEEYEAFAHGQTGSKDRLFKYCKIDSPVCYKADDQDTEGQ